MHSGMQVVEAAWAHDVDEGTSESKSDATERTALAAESGASVTTVRSKLKAAGGGGSGSGSSLSGSGSGGGARAGAAAAADDAADEGPVSRGPVYTFFLTVSGTTILAATLLAFAHAAALYTYCTRPARSAADRLEAATRFYELAFCFGVCVVELEFFGTGDHSVLGRSWLLRGFAYGFVGVMAFNAADDDARRRARDQSAPAAWRDDALLPYSLYLRSCAAAMLGVGALYALLGLLCCKGLKKHAELEYRKNLAQAELRSALTAELAHRGGPVANPV